MKTIWSGSSLGKVSCIGLWPRQQCRCLAFLDTLVGVLEDAPPGDPIFLLGNFNPHRRAAIILPGEVWLGDTVYPIRTPVVFYCWTSVLLSLSIINNTFKHTEIHQCTWHQGTLGWRSLINFMIMLSDLQPCLGHSGEERLSWELITTWFLVSVTVRGESWNLVEPSVREVFNSHPWEIFDQIPRGSLSLLLWLFGTVAIRSPVLVISAISNLVLDTWTKGGCQCQACDRSGSHGCRNLGLPVSHIEILAKNLVPQEGRCTTPTVFTLEVGSCWPWVAT